MADVSTIEIIACRGFEAGRCRFAMPLTGKHSVEGSLDIIDALRSRLQATGWDQFIREKMQGALRHHHSFKVALSACPNGCSRPHVADIGIIRAVMPARPSEACNACGLCINLCPDKALHAASADDIKTIGMQKGSPILDMSQCMACGLCVRRCPERALGRLDCSAQSDHGPQADGWRILLGGCLGRHPRLGTPLDGIHDSETVCNVVHSALAWYMQDYAGNLNAGQAGRRFARLVEAEPCHGAFLLREGVLKLD